MKNYYQLLKENINLSDLLQLLSATLILMLYYYTTRYFEITLIFFEKTIQLKWLLFGIVIALISAQKFKDNIEIYLVVLFSFWVLIIIILYVLFLTCINAFSLMENAIDNILIKDWFNIEIIYTKKYKFEFLLNYLVIIYPEMARKYKNIKLFDIKYFRYHLETHIINKINLKELNLIKLKLHSKIFLENYIEHLLILHKVIKSYQEAEDFYNSVFYQIFYFTMVLASVLIIPKAILLVGYRITKIFYPGYFLDKALDIAHILAAKAVRPDGQRYIFPVMTPQELQDWYLFLAQRILWALGDFGVYQWPL